jgi:hypothetical protein
LLFGVTDADLQQSLRTEVTLLAVVGVLPTTQAMSTAWKLEKSAVEQVEGVAAGAVLVSETDIIGSENGLASF